MAFFPRPSRTKSSRRCRQSLKHVLILSTLLSLSLYILLRGPSPSLIGNRVLEEPAARKTVNYWAAQFKRQPPGNATNYGTPEGYIHRPAVYFNDNLNGVNGTDNLVLWQADVYNYAAHFSAETPGSWLMDIGGGSGYKAATIFQAAPRQKFVVLDHGPNLELSRANFAETRRFAEGGENDVVFDEWNIDGSTFPEVGLDRVRGATIISADVIEHLSNPDNLVDGLLALMYGAGAKYIVISTVNKSEGRGYDGPPLNPHHVREWTMSELQSYIKSRGANHVDCGLTWSTNSYRYQNTVKRKSVCLVSRDTAKQLPPVESIRDFFPFDQAAYDEMKAEAALKKTVNYWTAQFKRQPPGNATNYGTPEGYIHRPAVYFNDNLNGVNGTDNLVLWQADVYNYAAHFAAETPGSWLVDIGGGSGYKAATIFQAAPRQKFVVLDHGPNLELSRANFAETRRFAEGGKNDVVFDEWNIDGSTFPEVGLDRVRGATIISADVIEHLSNPDNLVDGLLALMYGAGAKYIVISTLNRSRGRGRDGPPFNPHHVREWSISELESYIKSRGAKHVACELTWSTNMHRFYNTSKSKSVCLISRDTTKKLPSLKSIRNFFLFDYKEYGRIKAEAAKAAAQKTS